jgi:hypothetical protein
MDIERLSQAFWIDGYLVLEGFFENALMDHLDQLIRDYFGRDPAFRHQAEFLDRAQTEVIPWFPQQDGVADFDAIDRHADLQDLTQSILGPQWEQLYCMVMFSRKGTQGQAWHQDCEPEDPAVFNLNRLVYTHPISPEVGGETVVVPGSHRRGLLPAGNPHGELAEQVILSPGKGALVLLHGHTWHRVLPIRGEYRFSANYRAAPQGLTADLTDVCVYRNMRYRFSTASVVEKRVQSG